MGQSFNLNGILNSFKILTNPSLLIPQIKVNNFAHINFLKLKERGIKLVILDKDNCITKPYSLELEPEFKKPMNELKSNIDNVIILSNSAGSSDDKNYTQLQSIESNLKIKVFKHTQKKPLGGDEINAAYPHLKPSEIAMVGDRLLTDIMFANLNGYLGIHTQKVLSLKGDNWFAIKIRNLEYKLLDLFEYKLKLKPIEHPYFTNKNKN